MQYDGGSHHSDKNDTMPMSRRQTRGHYHHDIIHIPRAAMEECEECAGRAVATARVSPAAMTAGMRPPYHTKGGQERGTAWRRTTRHWAHMLDGEQGRDYTPSRGLQERRSRSQASLSTALLPPWLEQGLPRKHPNIRPTLCFPPPHPLRTCEPLGIALLHTTSRSCALPAWSRSSDGSLLTSPVTSHAHMPLPVPRSPTLSVSASFRP